MIKYVLRAFSQVLPNEAVNVDVQAVNDDPKFATSIACPPIEGLSADFDNAELLAAVCDATGQKVELPEADEWAAEHVADFAHLPDVISE